MINRYDYPVPEFSRTRWASAQAQATWEPRLQEIGAAWLAAERASVGRFRRVARQTILASQMPEFSMKATDSNLIAVALNNQAATNTYRSAANPGTGAFTVILADSTTSARMFMRAVERNDDAIIGDLLGFPACCSAFFQRVWGKRIDTTWDMLGPEVDNDGRLEWQVEGPVESNILLRWAGVRWVPHLPCSFNCPHTVALGQHFRSLVAPRIADWMDELLDSPMEWSALFGNAEIKTPLFTISAKTDATAERLAVRRLGRRYPEAGAQGTVFPYKRHVRVMATAPATLIKNPKEWTDNGFTSEEAMKAAHNHLASVFEKHVQVTGKTILDLGCGNALLVKRLCANGAIPVGVENDPARAKAARQQKVRVITANIADTHEWVNEKADVILMAAKRLLEMTPEQAQGVRDALRGKTVFTYSYDGVDFPALCTQAGLTLGTHDDRCGFVTEVA